MKLRTIAFGMATSAAIAFSLAAAAYADTPAQMAQPSVQQGYEPPRTPTGKPDFTGVWTNASTTPLTRPSEYGDRLTLSDEEVAALETATNARNARQNAPTPRELVENWREIGLQPDTLDECRSGSTGAACGYNAFWTAPGDLVMRVGGKGRTSHISYPANGRLPERVPEPVEARAEVVQSSEESTVSGRDGNPEERGLSERCIYWGSSSGPVMTDTLYNNNYKFVQTEDHLAIWVEMIHEVRVVRMDEDREAGAVRKWGGDSVGWWDGDTLVVETQGYHPRQDVRGGGPDLKTIERFTRVSPTRMHYAFHVEDPDTWVEPWGGDYEFSAVDGDLYEFACHEGNYGLENILSGGRAGDRERALAAR